MLVEEIYQLLQKYFRGGQKVSLGKYFLVLQSSFALVAELVDALDSKSSVFGRVGSIPTQGTLKTL